MDLYSSEIMSLYSSGMKSPFFTKGTRALYYKGDNGYCSPGSKVHLLQRKKGYKGPCSPGSKGSVFWDQGPINTKGTGVLALLGARALYYNWDKGIRVRALLRARAFYYKGNKGPCSPGSKGPHRNCVSSRHSRKCVTLLKLMTEMKLFFYLLEHILFDNLF